MTFPRYRVPHGGSWTKLRSQIYAILEPELPLQMYCTFYTSHRNYKAGPFTSPRNWITLDKEIIWDFPSYFLEWNHPDVPKPLKYMEDGHWGIKGQQPAQLIREYLRTPPDHLLGRIFYLDYWGLINILRAADRRIGQRRLRAFATQLDPSEPAMKVIRRRFSLRNGGGSMTDQESRLNQRLDHVGEMQDHIRQIHEEYTRRDQVLLDVIKSHLPALMELNREIKSSYEDGVYRFYHQSLKVYGLQGFTKLMVDQFEQIATEIGRELNPWFRAIVTEGSGRTFELDHNANWLEETRPIVEAFLHSKFFLEMMINHGLTLESVEPPFKYGWAAILTLYNQR